MRTNTQIETLLEEDGFKLNLILYYPNNTEPEPYITHNCPPKEARRIYTAWHTPETYTIRHCPHCHKLYPKDLYSKAILLNARFPVRTN